MEHLAQHFRAEERLLVERAHEWAELAQMRHHPQLTPFLNPREQVIVRSVALSLPGVDVAFWGGFEQAERKRGLIFPDYYVPENEEYKLALLQIEGRSKEALGHRELLGSILGLGLKREKIGDILVADQGGQVIVDEDIKDYICLHLTRVGKRTVQAVGVEWDKLLPLQDEWEERLVTVSSLRLDTVLANCVRLSRSKAYALIKGGKVQVNWKLEDSPDALLEEGDVLSVKGYGRFLVRDVEGQTRKGNLRLRLGYKK